MIAKLLLLLLCFGHETSSADPSYKAKKTCGLMALRPLAVDGKYHISKEQDFNTVFLGRKNLDVISSDDDDKDEVLICDLVPLLLTRQPFSDKDQYKSSVLTANSILNRDAGFYDSLPFFWASKNGMRPQDVKRAIFERCNIVKGNPGLALLKATKDILDAEISSLFIEVADEYGGVDGGVVIGAGAVIAQQGETSKKYRISRKDGSLIRSLSGLRKLPISKPKIEPNRVEDRMKERLILEEQGTEPGAPLVATVTCHLDEVVGLSRTLDMPVGLHVIYSTGYARMLASASPPCCSVHPLGREKLFRRLRLQRVVGEMKRRNRTLFGLYTIHKSF